MSHHSNAFSRGYAPPEGISSLRSVKLPFLTISPSPTSREKAKGDVVSSDRSLMLGGRSHFSFYAPSSEKQNGISRLVTNQKIPAYLTLNANHTSLRVPVWSVSPGRLSPGHLHPWPWGGCVELLACSRWLEALAKPCKPATIEEPTPAQEKVLPLVPWRDSAGAWPYRPTETLQQPRFLLNKVKMLTGLPEKQ